MEIFVRYSSKRKIPLMSKSNFRILTENKDIANVGSLKAVPHQVLGESLEAGVE